MLKSNKRLTGWLINDLDKLKNFGPVLLWVAVIITATLYAAIKTMIFNDADILYEAGDSAGDALQVRIGLSNGWFTTGHHTDTGVAHPGPFSLWVKAAAELMAPLFGVKTLWMSVVLFSAIKALAVTTAGAAVGKVLGSKAAGFSFIVIAFSGEWIKISDPVGVGMQTIGIWLVIASAATSLTALRGAMGFLPIAIFATGAAMHAHTTIFPAASAVFLMLTVLLLQQFHQRARVKWLSLVIWIIFVTPLIIRVFVEPGWPLNYKKAMENRKNATSEMFYPRERFELLGERMELSTNNSILALIIVVIVATVAIILFKKWRLAITSFIIFGIWAIATALLSPQNQQFATELYWITGWWAFCVSLGGAVIVALLLRVLPKIASPLAASAAVGMIFASVGVTFAAQISGTVGVDGSYVSELAGIVEKRADGKKIGVIIDRDWLAVEMGLILELDRRGGNFCVIVPKSRFTGDQELKQFISTKMLCPTKPEGEELVVSSQNDESEVKDIWYRQVSKPLSTVMKPNFVAGSPNCDPREVNEYPRCGKKADENI